MIASGNRNAQSRGCKGHFGGMVFGIWHAYAERRRSSSTCSLCTMNGD